jgi:hypothetical protein
MSFETVAGTACLDLANKEKTLELKQEKQRIIFGADNCSACIYYMTKPPPFFPVLKVLYIILARV